MLSRHAPVKVTKNKYNLQFFNRKVIITEGILCYFSNKSAFEDKLKVCRRAGIGIYVYNICLHCFETNAVAFYCNLHFGNGVEVDPCFLFLELDKLLNQ